MRLRLEDTYRGLSSLLRAGFGVREAVAQVHANGTLPGALGNAVAAEVGKGRPLSEALALFPDQIPAEDVALVEAGEATGNLDKNLDRAALRHENRRASRRRFWTAAAYPLLLYHLAAFATPIPASFTRDGRLFGPSWLTGFVLRLIPFYAVVLVARALNRRAAGRAVLRRAVLLIPGFGNALRRRRNADLAEVLGAAYGAGVQLDRALAIAGKAVEDDRLEAAASDVARGRTLAQSLAAAGALPGQLVSRVATGEHAGEISRVLEDIAREEADTADHVLRRSIQLAANLFYVAVALWIAWYVISTYMGIYSFAM